MTSTVQNSTAVENRHFVALVHFFKSVSLYSLGVPDQGASNCCWESKNPPRMSCGPDVLWQRHQAVQANEELVISETLTNYERIISDVP